MILNTTTPAGPPPSGVESDFFDPQYDGGRFVVVNITFLSIAVIMMIVRLYTQILLLKKVRLEDCFMLLAMLLSIAMSGLTLDLINYGLGKHMWDVPQLEFAAGFFKINLFTQVIYNAATATSKISILLLYLRIFPGRNFCLVVWAVIFVSAGYALASIFANLFGCHPIAKSWDPTIARGSCINRPALYYANCGLGIMIDFATLLVPIPMLKKPQLLLKQISVGLMLIVGGFVCIISVVRVGSVYKFLHREDPTYTLVNVYLWSTIELNMTIIGGSIPMLKPLVRHHFPCLLGLSSKPESNSRLHNRDYGPQGRNLRIKSVELPYIGDITQKSVTNVVAGGTNPYLTTDLRSEKFSVDDGYPEAVPRTGIMRTMGYKVEEDYGQRAEIGSQC